MKPKPVLLVLCFNCLICVSCNVNPACECVVYESSGSSPPSQGTFTSPNFPQIYPPNINCILYTFLGSLDEIVELTFLEFDLQVPITNKCSDYIRFFLDLERPEVNEASEHNYDLCGNISMIEKKHYSSDRALIFEFHTDLIQESNRGFRGRFKFLNKTQYEIQGCTIRWGQQCTYDCRSENNKYHLSNPNSGIIFSPRYPQNYPPNKVCKYIFKAEPSQRVKVVFTTIQLEPIDGSCSNSPDSITVYDGMDASSPVIAQYCNTMNRVEVVSSGLDLLVEFRSNGNKQRQGFAAVFDFEDASVSRHRTTTSTSTIQPYTVLSSDNIRGIRITEPTELVITAAPCFDKVSDCTQTINSQSSKSGVITSPNYPYTYPDSAKYTFHFEGQEDERIQLEFELINLYSDDDPSDCNDIDRVDIVIHIGDRDDELANYCGSRLPPLLMSNTNTMDVVLVTQPKKGIRRIDDNMDGIGFKAAYHFVTDYGIKSGRQRTDSGGGCVFEFRSSVHPNGTFTSPNFPGVYPRNTECHYLFYGGKDERIYITFPYFDVDGIPPQCQQDTNSDYIAFSNFNIGLDDQKMPLLCGARRESRKKEVESDKNFFRVTFKSNQIFDATGFEAFFQFRKLLDPFESGSADSLNSSSPPMRACPSLLIAVMILGIFLTCRCTL